MLLAVALGAMFLVLFGLILAAVSGAQVGRITGDRFEPELPYRTSGG
jgi:hypothetical protein